MKNFKLLLNNRFTATTQNINSELELQNNYYVYINKNGGGIVNQYNVRGYLNDSRNQQIINDFLTFLTGSTSQDQALNILTSDKKLSDTFNDYYQRVVISATQISSTAIIDQNLTGANQITSYTFEHPWSGYAPSKQLTGITQEIYGTINDTQSTTLLEDFTTEESYYVPVYLGRETHQLSRYSYDTCDVFINSKTAGFYPMFSGITNSYFGSSNISNIISNINDSSEIISLRSMNSILSSSTADTRIHTLLNCFVDINLEVNENSDIPSSLPSVSFEFNSYSISEGDPFQIRVGLDAPSTLGVEQVTIDLINPIFNYPIIGQDYVAADSYPMTLTWSAGEQYKFLSFSALTDFFEEPLEKFLLQISNIINLEPGLIINTSVGINDTTVLRKVSLSVLPPATPMQLLPGSQFVLVNEGSFIDMSITLDGPAFGVENITLSLVPYSITTGGTIGPSSSPLILNTDYNISATSMSFSFAPGETQKTFRFSALTDVVIENYESAIFELQNPAFCSIDENFKTLAVSINDTTGGYKYVHLNLGTIYSEFGDSISNTLMRQISPQPGPAGNYNNIYVDNYNFNLIEYGTTVNFEDYRGTYNGFGQHDSVDYANNSAKLKVTNTGEIQSIVNGISINTGQTTIITIPGNSFIVTASTNSNKNTTTNLYEYANYKLEMINDYSGTTLFPQMQFKLRNTGNTQSTNNTLTLGNHTLSGMTTNPGNTNNQYKLISRYKNVNTGRPNIGSYSNPIYTCPPIASFSYSVSFNEFYATNIEDVSVLGIIFLNYSQNANYTGVFTSKYDSFDFIATSTPYTITCAQSNSEYNGLDYISIPFHL